MSTLRECPTCNGSGKVKEITYFSDKEPETKSVDCVSCDGAGKVISGHKLKIPKPELRGTMNVINPGDPGYEEAKQRLLNKQKVG